MYPHESSRQKFKTNYEIDDYNHTDLGLQHVCMYHHCVCIIIVFNVNFFVIKILRILIYGNLASR